MAATDYPLGVQPPDITPWRQGNTGIDFVHSFDSGIAGPHVMVCGLMHGNEICGAIAVDRLLREGVRPRAGKLTFGFLNVGAYARFSETTRRETRFVDEDLNRVWVDEIIDGKLTAETQRARELRPLVHTVDYLLDIHSMGTPSTPLMLVHGLEKERAFAKKMGYPENVVCGPGHIRGRRLIEYAPFNDTGNDKTALLIECGQHWSASSAKVALNTALYFLKAAGTVDPAKLDPMISDAKPARQRILEVTGGVAAKTTSFKFIQNFLGLEQFPKGAVIAHDGGEDVVTPHDDCILVMPHSSPKPGERVLRFARQVE